MQASKTQRIGNAKNQDYSVIDDFPHSMEAVSNPDLTVCSTAKDAVNCWCRLQSIEVAPDPKPTAAFTLIVNEFLTSTD